jgi:hypothetical protein
METYLFNTPGREIEALIEGLDAPDQDERKIAEFALFSQGEKAVQPLVHALGVDDPAIRMEAARILGDMHLPETGPALVQALNDTDESVRAMAAYGLVELREDALHPIFERLASAPISDKMHAGFIQALQGLEDFGILRGNLKHIVEVMKANSPAAEIQSEAQELLKQID